ncbi:unnamed protein product [Sphagnum troendelagicum]|uniref:Uncharacterized protein n=1 Tax=Sphagnum troendelagicum TaxID=128251 RepID=A0ABP0TIW7_9BRYO
MAINSVLGGVKQKSLCSGFSADRAALEKLKYGLWTRMWRPALNHVWGLKVWIQPCSQSLDSHKDHTNLSRFHLWVGYFPSLLMQVQISSWVFPCLLL